MSKPAANKVETGKEQALTPEEKQKLEVDSGTLYHNYRTVLPTKKFKKREEDMWPMVDLTTPNQKLKAMAQLKPHDEELGLFPTPDDLILWQQKITEQVMAMSDLTADVLDAISSMWLKKAKHPSDMVQVRVQDFLHLRGLLPKLSGTGRRGGYEEEQYKEIARHIAILNHTWITVFEMDIT